MSASSLMGRDEIIARHPESFSHGHHMNIGVCERMLLDIKEIFDARGVRFWLWFGSFLGAYRDGRLIPTDDDIDLAVFTEDMGRVASCNDLFISKGFELAPEPNSVLYRDGEHADLNTFQLEGNKRVNGFYRVDANAFETENWIEFLGKRWRIISEPERWLAYIYGSNWRIPNPDFVTPGKPLGQQMLTREELLATDLEAFKHHTMNITVSERNLLDIKAVLESRGIKFWLWLGTFLGVYRDGALIPWDLDTDLAIYVEDMATFIQCQELFEEKGFKMSPTCIYREHEHTGISILCPEMASLNHRVSASFIIDASAFEKPNSIQFLGQEWNIVSEPERWLTYIYGHDWQIPKRDFVPLGIPHGGPAYHYSQSYQINADCISVFYTENNTIFVVRHFVEGKGWQ